MRNQVQSNRQAEGAPRTGGTILQFRPPGIRDPQAARVLGLVADACGVPAVLLLHPSRCNAEVAEARQLAMYLMHVILQRSYLEIGAYFRRDRTTVSHACACIEEDRDRPDFDAFVAGIEASLQDARADDGEVRDGAR